jgi:uncharacterized membrane protein
MSADQQVSSQSEGGQIPRSASPPSRWWTVLLIVSLALNVLVGAATATRFFVKERTERVTGAGYIQLVPRKFLADLPRERRRELLAVFREFRDEFRDGRKAARESAAKLADALESEPYDAAAVQAVADEFARSGTGMIAHGTKAAVQFVGRLTPDERRQLALRIRERAAAGRVN